MPSTLSDPRFVNQRAFGSIGLQYIPGKAGGGVFTMYFLIHSLQYYLSIDLNFLHHQHCWVINNSITWWHKLFRESSFHLGLPFAWKSWGHFVVLMGSSINWEPRFMEQRFLIHFPVSWCHKWHWLHYVMHQKANFWVYCFSHSQRLHFDLENYLLFRMWTGELWSFLHGGRLMNWIGKYAAHWVFRE